MPDRADNNATRYIKISGHIFTVAIFLPWPYVYHGHAAQLCGASPRHLLRSIKMPLGRIGWNRLPK